LKKPYVAIVDDDSGFANYLRTFLSLRGYETRSYSRGDERVASVKQGDPPDVVLLDVMACARARIFRVAFPSAAAPVCVAKGPISLF
jgi:CheY-like chemotaxis protein